MRRLALAVLLVSSGAAARTAIERTEAGPEAQVRAVRGELTGTVATLKVTYAFVITEPGFGSMVEHLALPPTAQVIDATVRRDGTEHRLDLMGAELAAKKWDALAADGEIPSRPGSQRTAVLIVGESGQVTVSLATPKRGRFELELTLATPTCFHHDTRYAAVPEAWAGHLRGGLRTLAKPGEELVAACGGSTDDVWLAFPAPEVARRRSGDRIGAFAARLDAGQDHFVRLEVNLASELADVPADLATVIVVDGSRSMTTEQREAQRQLVVSYLREARATRVQVVAFARTARPLLPSWTMASRAAPRVDRELRALAPRNGSNLDVGLAEAGAWLERIEGTRRVVLVTDERVAHRLLETQPATLKRTLPAGTLVHVVSTVSGGAGVERTDSTLLAPLAAATDGIAVSVAADGDAAIDATMLVRPLSVDALEVTAPGWSQLRAGSDLTCGAEPSLAGGDACTWWGHGDVTSGPIAIAGLVWGRRITRVLRPDPAHGIEVARELSMIEGTSLDEPLRDRIAKLARGVNAQWSMYAEWGGTGGHYEEILFGISGSSCCHGGSFTTGHSVGIGVGTVGTYIEPENLSAQLAPVVAACKLDKMTARADVEMTLLEIVAVTVHLDGGSEINPNELRRIVTCVEDAIWDASPTLARPLAHSRHVASFGAP